MTQMHSTSSKSMGRNKRLARVITGLSAAAVFGGVVAHSGVSQAFWSRQAPMDCSISLGNGSTSMYDGCNTSTANSLVVACPVNDTSSQPKSSITTMNLHVHDNTSSGFFIAIRCVDFFNAVGSACGASDSSVNGIDTLTPPTFAGWNATDFGSVYVTMPPASGANKSCIKGLYTAG